VTVVKRWCFFGEETFNIHILLAQLMYIFQGLMTRQEPHDKKQKAQVAQQLNQHYSSENIAPEHCLPGTLS